MEMNCTRLRFWLDVMKAVLLTGSGEAISDSLWRVEFKDWFQEDIFVILLKTWVEVVIQDKVSELRTAGAMKIWRDRECCYVESEFYLPTPCKSRRRAALEMKEGKKERWTERERNRKEETGQTRQMVYSYNTDHLCSYGRAGRNKAGKDLMGKTCNKMSF